jgi:transcriptional regulator with AAA-type ATPase domain
MIHVISVSFGGECMMKRIDKVYDYVKQQTESLSATAYPAVSGVTTQEVSEALGIQRANASKDLNQLVREGRLKKTDSRPVKYISQMTVQYEPLTKPVKSYRERSIGRKKPINETNWFNK